MHSDARSLPIGTEIQGDLCIVGAGAAGITIAREFAGTRFDIILLEAGGFEKDPDLQALYEGENTGLPYFPLDRARLRYFGGTTNHWNGWCSTLDPIDFKERDWVPMSGWPLSREDLKPYYRRAHPLLDLGEYNYNVEYWKERKDGFTPFPFDESEVRTKIFKRSAPSRFGKKYRSVLLQAENVTLWTHANVTEIQTPPKGSEVKGLRVECLNGKEHRVKARQYVLACGGLENPRLLLNSNRDHSNGLGNDRGLVGRYFMEHPHVYSANLDLKDSLSSAYDVPNKSGGVFGLLSLRPEQQRTHRLLNYTAFLRPGRFARSLPRTLYNIPNMRGLENYIKSYLGGSRVIGVQSRVESRPNPDSRVTLSAETDALDQPRIELHWSLTDHEKRTIRRALETIAKECGRLGIGRLQLLNWVTAEGTSWPDHLHGGSHHMGTTRMSSSPEQGVVDADCNVHGVQNLYVAGSSVYPTSGVANPTLTLVALALRLSDHLKAELRA